MTGVQTCALPIFDWYAPHLPRSGAVLDWGCNYAPDSCLLRACFGDRFELHGCDFHPPGKYQVFHDFAQLDYTQLTDPLVLPYDSQQFDFVIAAGTLEHTAMDYESLKELYRVLKPGGKLVIDRLPNWLSFGEWKQRHVWKARFHRRLYGVRDTTQLLKRTGFYPIDGGYHSLFWERRLRLFGSGPRVASWCRALTKVLPFRMRCPTLRFIAEKRKSM